MSDILEYLREQFKSRRNVAEVSEKIAHNSYGAGYDRGYSDAFGELIEMLDGAAMTEWQPIETAPRDGRRVLLFTTHVADDYCDETFNEVQIGSWDDGHIDDDPKWSRDAGWELEKIGEPSRWMPLPSPPNLTKDRTTT